jgi:low affinity Fe/Cu permease
MTLLIQRAEHRDTQALQAKLDELLHAHRRAVPLPKDHS